MTSPSPSNVPRRMARQWRAEGTKGAVAAGARSSVAAGLRILDLGGNAADAAVATILALAVSDYGLFAMGGECPLMIAEARTGRTTVLSGVGTAPRSDRAMQWFETHGIPADGHIKTAPVPGAPDLCFTALIHFGTLSFAAVAQPCIELLGAEHEFWHRPLARTLTALCETECRARGNREDKLRALRDRFYRGDMADTLADFYARSGSFLSKDDLATHETRIEEPVAVDFRGYTILKCGPWTQGPMLCQACRILEGFDLAAMQAGSAEAVHVTAEALKLAFADRDHYFADPQFATVPVDALLSTEYTALRRGLIDLGRAIGTPLPGDPLAMKQTLPSSWSEPWTGGTTTCVVCDRDGNLVAATPSANQPYTICPELGIAHGNRLRCLNTTPGHPNHIQPGKRPRITLTPTLVCQNNTPRMAISVAGGDLQDQTSLNCLLNVIEYGMTPAEAVTAPRFSVQHHENSFRPDRDRQLTVVGRGTLTLDSSVPAETAEALEAKGHVIARSDGPIAAPVMLSRDPDSGLCQAAGDPRAGRHAGTLPG